LGGGGHVPLCPRGSAPGL